MNEKANTVLKEKEAVDCFCCERSIYCAEVLEKIITVFSRLGIADFTFKIHACRSFKDKNGRDNNVDKETVDKILNDLV